MKYGRNDYNRIPDPAGKILEDEPVFLLRGQDKHAARVVRFYADCVEADNGDPKVIAGARDHADLMDEWPIGKAPDF